MNRHGKLLAPSHLSTSTHSLARSTATGPIIDIYPGFEPPRPRARQPAVSQRRPFPRAWSWVALLVVAAVTAAIAFRGLIVEAVPSLGKAYAVVGLSVAETHLQLNNVKVIGVYGRDEISVAIQGEVANLAGRQLNAAEIVITLRSIDGRELTTQTIDPTRITLDPGGTYRFATEFVDPPANAHDISIRIGDGPGRNLQLHLATRASPPIARQ